MNLQERKNFRDEVREMAEQIEFGDVRNLFLANLLGSAASKNDIERINIIFKLIRGDE